MPTQVTVSSSSSSHTISITAVPLTASSFAPFGHVIQNPSPHLTPSPSLTASDLPPSASPANQGSAIKYAHVSRPLNLYSQAPSQKPATEITSLFACAARALNPPPVVAPPISTLLPYSYSSARGGRFVVEIMERHPFTTQTFIPLGNSQNACYLVIVAPSLPPSKQDEQFPVPQATGGSLPGRGLPDVQRLQAFVATADQAVTYGAGTWHSPMVALGQSGSSVDFVVCQSANGVAIEDCQEVVFSPQGPQIVVQVPGRASLPRL